MKNILRAVMLICCLPATSWAASVEVSFQPSSTTVNVGDTFTVNIVADILDPVLGWGLDVSSNASLLSPVGAPVIGPDWLPYAPTPDGDDLAGIAFPLPISGNDILLATLTLKAVAPGVSALIASTTPGDFDEGFALESPPGAFADVVYQYGSVTVKQPGDGGPVNAPAIPPLGLVVLWGLLALVGVRFLRR